ncbi:MAG: FMN-binding protein [Oscillospiraceae bacterium]|nr:FMN-binding protein [Oscillospiraceae bacterium]
MKNNNLLKSLLCLALLLAVMGACVLGVNAFTAPIVAENERLAEEARLAAEKEKLGDSVMLFDRADPENAQLTVTADTVQKVYRDEEKQVYILSLRSDKGYEHEKGPIEMTLVIDFEGKIVSLTVDSSAETRELSPEFLPSFEGQDSTLSGVEQVAGVTYSTKAIKGAVNDGFETLIANELFAGAQKSDEQLIEELIPVAYPGIVNAAGAIQGEELAGSGSVTGGFKANNGSGCLWFAEKDGKQLLAVYTLIGGLKILNPAGEDVTDAEPALAEEIKTLSASNLEEIDPTPPKKLRKQLPEGAEPVPVEIPGLSNTVVAAWSAETEEGTYYAFIARPYGFEEKESGGVMEVYFVLDAQGAISGLNVKSIYLGDFYDAPDFTIADYREGFLGSTAETFDDGVTQISGATISSGAVKTATHDVFEAFALLTADRG